MAQAQQGNTSAQFNQQQQQGPTQQINQQQAQQGQAGQQVSLFLALVDGGGPATLLF